MTTAHIYATDYPTQKALTVSTDLMSIQDSEAGNIGVGTTIAGLAGIPAANIVNTPSGNLTATDVQAALNELQVEIDSVVSGIAFQGGWDASSGSFPGGGTAQTGDLYKVTTGGTVDSVSFAAGDSIYAETDNASTTTFSGNWVKVDSADSVTSIFSRTGAVVAVAGDYTAAQITNTPSGGVSAVTVQAAIDELDSEKVDANLTTGTISAATENRTIEMGTVGDEHDLVFGNVSKLQVFGTSDFKFETQGLAIQHPGASQPGKIKLFDDNNSSGVDIWAHHTIPTGFDLRLPDGVGAVNQVLGVGSLNSSTDAQLEWQDTVTSNITEGTLALPTGTRQVLMNSQAFSIVQAASQTFGATGSIAFVSASMTVTSTTASEGGRLSLREGTTNGTSSFALKASDSMAADYTLVMPAAEPTAGQILEATSIAAGVITASWVTPVGGGSDTNVTTGTVAAATADRSISMGGNDLDFTSATKFGSTDGTYTFSVQTGGLVYTGGSGVTISSTATADYESVNFNRYKSNIHQFSANADNQATVLRLLEAADNGVNDVEIKVPTALAASYDLELPDALPASGTHLVTLTSAGKLATQDPFHVAKRQVAQQSTTSSTPTEVFTFTFTKPTGTLATRMILSFDWRGTNLANDFNYELKLGGTNFRIANIEPKDTLSWHPVTAMWIWNNTEMPSGSRTLSMTIWSANNTDQVLVRNITMDVECKPITLTIAT